MHKRIPQFDSEQEEQNFWADNDSANYVDWSTAERAAFPNLKASTKRISVRLPEHLLYSLKVLANKRGVPYQSLLKVFLFERVEGELRKHGGDTFEDAT